MCIYIYIFYKFFTKHFKSLLLLNAYKRRSLFLSLSRFSSSRDVSNPTLNIANRLKRLENCDRTSLRSLLRPHDDFTLDFYIFGRMEREG